MVNTETEKWTTSEDCERCVCGRGGGNGGGGAGGTVDPETKVVVDTWRRKD